MDEALATTFQTRPISSSIGSVPTQIPDGITHLLFRCTHYFRPGYTGLAPVTRFFKSPVIEMSETAAGNGSNILSKHTALVTLLPVSFRGRSRFNHGTSRLSRTKPSCDASRLLRDIPVCSNTSFLLLEPIWRPCLLN